MARKRNGQCKGCGTWLSIEDSKNLCQACKAPPVRRAVAQVFKEVYRKEPEEVVIEEGAGTLKELMGHPQCEDAVHCSYCREVYLGL